VPEPVGAITKLIPFNREVTNNNNENGGGERYSASDELYTTTLSMEGRKGKYS
jgi:hypothetical protein